MAPNFVIKFASTKREFDQINDLNYRTFVEEIPQHAANSNRRLIDKFDSENTYLICLDQEKLAGMVTFRDKRPFSLDNKLQNLDAYLPSSKHICEIRLLSIEKEYRDSPVFWLLLQEFEKIWKEKGYDLLVISGTTRQLRLYNFLGLIPFGPIVGTDEAQFQPMYWTRDAFLDSLAYKRMIEILYEK